MLKTTNSGVNWFAIDNGLPNDDVLDIGIFSGILGDILYVTTKDNGVYRSADGGANWTAKGLSGETLNDIVIDPTSSATVYAAASNGVWKTTDSGNNWNQMTNGTSGKEIIELEIHPEHTSIIFAVAKDESGHYIYVSLDGGDDWVDKSSGLPDEFIPYFDPSTPARPYVPLSIDPDYPDTLYMGTLNGIMEYPFMVGCGSITSNTTWGPNPVFVTCDVKVEDGVTLTICEGTEIFIASDYDGSNIGDNPDKVEIIVEGNMIASGQESYPIVMASSDVSPSAGDWEGIKIISTGSISMDYTEVSYAYKGVYGVEEVSDRPDSLRFDNCRFLNHSGSSIDLNYPSSLRATKIRNCYFENCGYGIRVRKDIIADDPAMVIEQDSIIDCKTGIFYIGNSNSTYEKRPSISHCTILKTAPPAVGCGIYASTYSGDYLISPEIFKNSITGFAKGISLSSVNAHCEVISNDVRSNEDYGLYLQNASPNIIPSISYGPNLFISSEVGIYCDNNSGPYVRSTKIKENSHYGVLADAGTSPPPDFGTRTDHGGNSIYSSSPWIFYADMKYTGFSTQRLSAVGNWWGEYPPDPSEIIGNIDYSEALEEDPLWQYGKRSPTYVNIPDHFNLLQNFPNPFNPNTEISFYLPEPGFTDLKIYNLTGQLVKKLISGNLDAGEHIVVWDGKNAEGNNVSSGIYFYILSTEDKKIAKKMTLIR